MNANAHPTESIRKADSRHVITPAMHDEIDQFIAIDKAASELFRGSSLIKPDALDDHVPRDAFAARIDSHDAFAIRDETGAPLGFTITSPRKRSLYLDQISVDPAHGRKGLGRMLVAHVLGDAKHRGFRHVTLSTFRDLPWNGPFYASCGFKEIPYKKLTDWMRELEQVQAEDLDISARCFMQCKTG